MPLPELRDGISLSDGTDASPFSSSAVPLNSQLGASRARIANFLFLLPLLSLLSGCAVLDSLRVPPRAATPNLSPEERLRLASDLLDQGRAKRANVELKAYLAALPNNNAAANNTPSPSSNPSSNNNTLPSGAPANSKPAPPAPPKAAAAVPKDPPAPDTSADPWAAIRENVQARRYDAAIEVAESNHVAPDRAQAELLASAYVAHAKAVRRSNATQSGVQALRAGQLYLETADMPEEAFDALQIAVAVSPNDVHAQALLASAKSKTVEIYYRGGQIAFRRQDLDGAVAAWDRVLAIDPHHEKAQSSRAQALELKKALQKLM